MDPAPNGPSPVAAKASSVPRPNTSLAGPTGAPSACSGAMNPGEPITMQAWVSALAPAAREMPKSITRGPSAGDQYVRRLEVAVHQAGRVDHAEGRGQPRTQHQDRVLRQRAVPADQFGQGRTGHVAGGQPGLRPAGVRARQRRGEWPAHGVDGGHFLVEPGPESGIPGQVGPDYLDRDQVSGGRATQEHRAHAPAAQPAEQLGTAPPAADRPPAIHRSCPALPPQPSAVSGLDNGRRAGPVQRVGSAVLAWQVMYS